MLPEWGLTLNQSRKETVARQGELQLHKRVVVHHRVWSGGLGQCSGRWNPRCQLTVAGVFGVIYLGLSTTGPAPPTLPAPPPVPTQASSELLHSDRDVEAGLEAKVALAEALARQWFGVVVQPA